MLQFKEPKVLLMLLRRFLVGSLRVVLIKVIELILLRGRTNYV